MTRLSKNTRTDLTPLLSPGLSIFSSPGKALVWSGLVLVSVLYGPGKVLVWSGLVLVSVILSSPGKVLVWLGVDRVP